MLQVGKSSETMKSNVVEPNLENVRADIDEQKQETADSTIN